MSTRTRQDPDVRAEAIVEEASALFGMRGVKGTTVAAVAERVGLTDAGVLHHFATKRALLTAVLERSTMQQADAFRQLIGAGGLTALQQVRDWGQVMTDQEPHTRLEIRLGAEGLEPGSELYDFFQTRYRVVRRWVITAIELGVERGDLRPDTDAEREATALIAFLDGVRLQWAYGLVPSLADAVRDYVDDLTERLGNS